MASSSFSTKTTPPPPPPSALKKNFLRRILPVLVITNVAVGVYVLLRTPKKEEHQKDEGDTVKVPSAPAANASVAVPEKTSSPVESSAPIKILPPVPEQEQRELFKWILDEKRKIKPKNSLDKKKIDEEKALLKEFIRAKSIPSI